MFISFRDPRIHSYYRRSLQLAYFCDGEDIEFPAAADSPYCPNLLSGPCGMEPAWYHSLVVPLFLWRLLLKMGRSPGSDTWKLHCKFILCMRHIALQLPGLGWSWLIRPPPDDGHPCQHKSMTLHQSYPSTRLVGSKRIPPKSLVNVLHSCWKSHKRWLMDFHGPWLP